VRPMASAPPLGEELDGLLARAVAMKASDVHFTVGLPPQVRVDGLWRPVGQAPLLGADCEDVARHFLGDERLEAFRREKEWDLSYSIDGVGRFRVNVFYQRGSIGVAVRVLPYEVPGFRELGLPVATLERLCGLPHGIVLICGATGSGKSTTLAAMVSYINDHFSRHIVTIEDPIEFLHPHRKCIVDQREIGADTPSFASAMRHVLRQSPDVVLVGEIRDPESVRAALMIAETGHLLLTTIHTGEVAQGLSRLVDMFPPEQEREIRVSLSLVLQGMLVQQLLPGQKERSRVLATEVMIVNPAIRSLVREGKFEQVYNQIQTRKDLGMHTMNSSLLRLWREGEILPETALAKSPNAKDLRSLMEHARHGAV